MIFSKSCEYGVRATIYISQQSLADTKTGLKDIAKEIASPEAFTAKILQSLVKYKIVQSQKGPNGGFYIEKEAINKLRLADIVSAMDGDIIERTCVLGLKKCSEQNPCPVHNKYKHIKKDLLAMLQHTGLNEMSFSLQEGLSCLKL